MKWIRYTLAYYLALIDSEEDQSKFEYLYHQYKKPMYYKAREILRDDFLAEDAVHDAFCKIARNMNKISDAKSSDTKSFVMIVTRRAAIDAYRKRKPYFEKEVYEPESEDNEHYNFLESCGAAVEMPEMTDFCRSEVGKALRKLSDDYHDILLLRYVLGYDNREISEITGFTVSKIEKDLSRGKKKLADLLSAEARGDA